MPWGIPGQPEPTAGRLEAAGLHPSAALLTFNLFYFNFNIYPHIYNCSIVQTFGHVTRNVKVCSFFLFSCFLGCSWSPTSALSPLPGSPPREPKTDPSIFSRVHVAYANVSSALTLHKCYKWNLVKHIFLHHRNYYGHIVVFLKI